MGASRVGTSGGVFISYRRQETDHLAGRLYDRLADRLGDERVFMDVDSIDPGVNFAAVIAEAVSSCDALLALIGPRWVSVAEEDGSRRLDNPHDFVRLEIEEALSRKIRVIPILAEGAAMPRSNQLPAALKELAALNAYRISHETFRQSAGELVEVVERLVFPEGEGRPRPRAARAYREVLDALAAGHFEDALGVAEHAILVAPNSADSLAARAQVYASLGRNEEALHDAQRAVDLEPSSVAALTARADAHFLLERFEEALRDAQRAVEFSPSNVEALTSRAITYAGMERPEDALRDAQRAVELDPSNVFALLARAVAFMDMERPEDALVDVQRALELAPSQPYALATRGAIYLALARQEEALRDIQRALERIPSSVPVLITRAFALLELERYEDALRDAQRAVERSPSIDALWARALARAHLGQRQEAAADVERILARDPNHRARDLREEWSRQERPWWKRAFE